MAKADAMHHYYLLDGAQLAAEERDLLPPGETITIYADLGQEAAGVGPILAETAAIDTSLVTALEDQVPRRHALSELVSTASLSALAQHFRASRYLKLEKHSQHFLRYADTRVLAALTRVLDAPQLSSLFGPVERWSYRDRTGTPVVCQRPNTSPAPVPLRLNQAQQRQLFRLTAPDQLLAEVLADEPALADCGNDSERHAWAAAALDFLEQRRMRSFPWRLAMANAAVRSNGRALDNPDFIALVDDAFARGDFETLYDWKESMETSS